MTNPLIQGKSISDFRNNCTLVAARELTGRPDAEIMHAFLEYANWTPGNGCYQHNVLSTLRLLGAQTKDITLNWRKFQEPTLGQFCADYPQGSFYVSVRGHALVVRDGHIIDPNYSGRLAKRRRVLCAVQILNPPPSPVTLPPRQLTRGSDPVVRMQSMPSNARSGYRSKSAVRYRIAFQNHGKQDIRLSVLTTQTAYTRADAAYDIKHGHLVIIEQ